MHAIRLHAFGPAENLTYERTEDPVPGPGQVRIAVEAAGVHLLDTALREGHTGPFPAPATLPTIPGREVAGTVESLGEGGRHIVHGWSGGGLHDGRPLTFTSDELAERAITSTSVLGPQLIERGGGLRTLETRALAEAAAGRLRPAVQRYPLAQAAAAHRALETRGTIGKVVLEP
ncbi:zinc-binding dehydrogenase [Streptomyces sp. bgisy029]|uniref:zinc-binding dehydrogenase n=1 Tax=Streptomyces sp. bgisy029 TaxID=3413771 RepID=UPI003D749610